MNTLNSLIIEGKIKDFLDNGVVIESIRHYKNADGNIYRSIEINQSRFGYSDEVKDVLKNTVDFLNK